MHESIISQFAVSGTLLSAEPFGSGLINETYLCEFDDGSARRKYILQHINKTVFKHPDQVMENVEIVTEHVRHRLLAEGIQEPEAVTPVLIKTTDGRAFHRNGSGDAYLKAGLVGPSEAVPLIDGRLGLSRWQNLFFCEFDGPRQDRKIVVTVQ